MKKILLLLIALTGLISQAQVKIGDNPTVIGSGSSLELESTNKALVITRVANTAAITAPVNGMIVYDISSNCIKAYENGAWTNCLSNGSNIEPSTNGTAVVSSYTCSTASAGTLNVGVTPSGVTQTITAQVTSVGTYSISTFANGIVFSASGTFTNTGAQNVVLTAIGSPVISGTFSFAINTTPSCSFSRNVIDLSSNGTAGISAFVCSTASAGVLTVGTAVSGVTQTITATVTTAGTYNISTAAANGVTFSGTGSLSTGSQTIVLTATGTPTAATTGTYTLNTTPNCNFTRTAVNISSGGSAVVSAYNCSTASVGAMTAGTAVSGVTQTVTVTVTTVGTYNITTNTANGITFSGSGTFAGTGSQAITLTASGTPTAAASATFNINATPTCSFTRIITESFTASTNCRSYGGASATVTVGSTTVNITRSGTSFGSGTSSGTTCGITSAASSTITAVSLNNTVNYQFSVPLKNVQVFGGGNSVAEGNEGYTVTASLAGVPVPVQLSAFGTCASNYAVSQSGNSSTVNIVSGTTILIGFNIGTAGSAYDTISITRVGNTAAGANNVHGLVFCNAAVAP